MQLSAYACDNEPGFGKRQHTQRLTVCWVQSPPNAGRIPVVLWHACHASTTATPACFLSWHGQQWLTYTVHWVTCYSLLEEHNAIEARPGPDNPAAAGHTAHNQQAILAKLVARSWKLPQSSVAPLAGHGSGERKCLQQNEVYTKLPVLLQRDMRPGLITLVWSPAGAGQLSCRSYSIQRAIRCIWCRVLTKPSMTNGMLVDAAAICFASDNFLCISRL